MLFQGNIPQLVKHAGRLWGFPVSDMIDHFELEERVFFPSFSLSVHSPTTARLVLRFQKEHGYFEICEVKELFPLIETNRRCMYCVKKLASE